MNGLRPTVKTRMKILDATLMALLGSLALAEPALATEESGSTCNGGSCPVVAALPQEAMPQARIVEIKPTEIAQATVSGNMQVRLDNGGTIWATEDPQLTSPSLTVSANTLVAFEGGRIVRPVQFASASNYTAFMTTIEVRIYRATDVDRVNLLATVPLPLANIGHAEWDGAYDAAQQLRQGDDLVFIVHATDAAGHVDETLPQTLHLVRPEDLARQQQQAVNSAGAGLKGLPDQEILDRQLLATSLIGNGLRLQNIPVYGSRVRIRGQNLPANASLKINGEAYPVDLERKVAAEFLLPIGHHRFDLDLVAAGTTMHRLLDIDVTGKYFFMVALADLTWSKNTVGGAVVPVNHGDRYDEFLSEGRLAFYLKGKVQGKYLITAQADTHEQEVRGLFNGFLDADARDVFRRLDPDQYYPVYGDASTTYRDVDTQGRLYVRVDWDKNQLLWGNFQTGLTGNEYAQYIRSLYGAALSWRSSSATALGDPRQQVRAFASQAQTALGHSEFLGTGGSLYYLRHTDVLRGSEHLVVEVRDRISGRVEATVVLLRGADFEIDELQGRLLLTRPLSQIVRDNVPSIIRDTPLDGFENHLLVDYEYIPAGLSTGQLTSGFRGKTWLGEHIAIGGTYVDENRSGDDYKLRGLDLTLQAGRGTYLKLEQAHSEATSAPVFYSDNGGLSFTQINATAGSRRDGDARSVEARINFHELGLTSTDWTAGAWWRNVDAGFSVARADVGQTIRESGVEFAGQVKDNLRLSGRYSDAMRGRNGLEQALVLLEWRPTTETTLSGELRRVTETIGGVSATGSLAAVRYARRIGSSLDIYAVGQATLTDDHGRYNNNNAVTLGARYLFSGLSNAGVELTSGNRGNAVTANAEYFLNPQHSFYAGYTYSSDPIAGDALFGTGKPTGLTFGQRWRISSQVNLFNESQFLKARDSSGVAHTLGMDFYPGQGWNLGFNLQDGKLVATTGTVDRHAISLSGGHTSADLQWSSKLEWRRDSGAEDRQQWVSTNRFMYKVNNDWQVAGRLNYSNTEDRNSPQADARFIESNIGFAYRPAADDRWNVLGKYTYLYDLGALGQNSLTDYDQRSQIFSIEGIYRASHRWEMAGKLAERVGSARLSRDNGPWFDNTADLAVLQARYDLAWKWDALLEYRWLYTRESQSTRRGWLAGLDRKLGDNFRVGIGYNFTQFSDDLAVLDFNHKGWFLNVTGSY